MDGLVEEAMKKASVAWVSVADRPPLALWCVPVGGSLYMVTGPGEQSAPGIEDAAEAGVTLRGDHGGQIVTWPAEVARVAPGTEEWETVVPQLAAKRLNAPGTAEELAKRWGAECLVTRLAPADAPAQTGAGLPDGSLATAPRPTPATRPTPKPFRLHRVRRRKLS